MERIALCLHRSTRCSDSSRSSCLRTSIGRTAVRPSSGTLTCSTGGTSECAVSGRPRRRPRRDRLYLARRARRAVANEDAVWPLLAARGFTRLDPGELFVCRASGCVQWRRVHRGPPRGGDDEHLVRAARVPCSGAVCAEWRDCRLLPARDRAWVTSTTCSRPSDPAGIPKESRSASTTCRSSSTSIVSRRGYSRASGRSSEGRASSRRTASIAAPRFGRPSRA